MRFSDAKRVRQRVEAHASQLRLRGARTWVLSAVLTMLCTRWSKVTDDRMRLSQLVDVITEHGGRRYDLKTIGRALASLAADELIDYRPAQGRGACAVVAIHARFVTDIEILPRDQDGHVVVESVTFSDPDPSISQNPHPPTPRRRRAVPTTRPTEVDVNPAEVRTVLRELPEVYQQLPMPLLWRLGGEIRRQLAAGWLPEQILAVLSAPLPPDVQRPWRLALYRLRRANIGAGPRLKPLQDAWDQRTTEAERQTAEKSTNRWLAAVTDATDEQLRQQILLAAQQLRPSSWRPVSNPKTALAHAGRMALREYPTHSLTSALRRWTTKILGTSHTAAPPPAPTTTTVLDLIGPTSGDTCVSCLADSGSIRHELPEPIPVCDHCWTKNADPDLLEDIPA